MRFSSWITIAWAVTILGLDPASARAASPAEDHVRALAARIEALNPRLNAVIAVDPAALTHAATCPAGGAARPRRSLDCMAILIKDNIAVAGSATTAGSLAMIDNLAGRDAPIVAALRRSDGIILGRANLSEWAGFRAQAQLSGWSAVGGLTHNPHALDRSAAGSSSGSAVAVAAGLADAAIGTDTSGSITAPAALNGVVGFKPTIGMVSRSGIVPISSSQDSAGPIARDVRTVARIMDVIAFRDPADPASLEAPPEVRAAGFKLRDRSLSGVRFGVLRWGMGYSAGTDAVFEKALQLLRTQGAVLVDIQAFPAIDQIGKDQFTVMLNEFKAGLNGYLATTPPGVEVRTLADLIAFNRAHADRELGLFGQELLEQAEATASLDNPEYIIARDRGRRLAGTEGLARMMRDNHVAALIAPTVMPAFKTDTANLDTIPGGMQAARVIWAAAVAGYPHLTVPMGTVRGLPVGISFVGAAWSDRSILELGLAFERAADARVAPRLLGSTEEDARATQPTAARQVR